MAAHQSHVSLSIFLAVVYAVIGFLILELPFENVLLAAVFVILAGMLPDIDGGSEPPAKELSGLLSCLVPLLMLRHFPNLNTNIIRISLVVIIFYFITKLVSLRFLQKYTTRRGMMHSIPFAILTAEVCYLFYTGLPSKERLYIATGAFVGYISHLILDGYGNLDLAGQAMGKGGKKPATFKFLAPTFTSTFVLYGITAYLGWMIAKDFYPNLGMRAPVTY